MNPSPLLPRPSRARALLGLLAALLVQGLWLGLLGLLRLDGRGPQRPPAAGLLELRIVAPAAKAVARPLAGPLAEALVRRETAVPRSPATPGPALDGAAPVPSVNASATAITPPPLRLGLPPPERAASGPRAESMLGQMLNDPRSHSPRRTVEAALADAAGSLPVDIQSSTDGTNSRLVRQGSKCVRVSEARIKTLNPMDEQSKGAPAVSGACVNG
ncbi:MAG: hypothetical protein ABW005_09490 [Burkholderiaceae bacterium]